MDPYLGDCVPDAVHQGDVNKHLSAKYSLLFFIHFCTVALHTHRTHRKTSPPPLNACNCQNNSGTGLLDR